LARSENLQLKILRELSSTSTFGSFLRPTYTDIANKLGVDEETVRIRVRRAERAGTIRRWQVEINPHILGCEATSVLLDVTNLGSKSAIISQIRLVDQVVMVVDFYDSPLRVDFYHENDRERDRRVDLIKSICGDKNPVCWQRVSPTSIVKLKRTDWQILKSLRRDSMQGNAAIAKEIGVSARTVKRRISYMTEERAIFSHTLGDVSRVPGMAYFFLVHSEDEKKKTEIDTEIHSRLENAIFADTRNKQFSIYAAAFRNMGEANEMYRWIRSLDGAEKTRMHVMREIIPVPNWVDDEIERRLKDST
jgi:DNA-binding Lrp family transcriptional regulator